MLPTKDTREQKYKPVYRSSDCAICAVHYFVAICLYVK